MRKKLKKWLSVVLVVSLLCAFGAAMPSYADGLQMDISDGELNMTKYDIVLDEYFAERESLYMSAKSEFDPDRWEFIQEWKELLGGITFRSAQVEWSITEVMSETASETKLRIYEYISLVYVCNGYDVERNMKFGLDHILRLTKDESGYQVSADAYVEPVGYKAGLAEDLAVFEAEKTALIGNQEEIAVMQTTSSTGGNYTVNPNYNPVAAINYSYQWNAEGVGVSGYNPVFYYYDGVDCCNFVSQCVYAGGMTMDSTWRTTLANANAPIADNSSNPAYSSVAWVNTASFRNYWVNTKGYYCTQVTNASQAIPGNTFFWLSSNAGETYNHNMLIVDVDENGNILVNMHTGNQEEYPWSLNTLNDGGYTRKFYTIDFTHDFGISTSQGSSGHVHSCSLCGTAVTESHDSAGEASYDDTTHSPTCSECGYEWPAVVHTQAEQMGYTASVHYYRCTGCDHIWSSEAHNKKLVPYSTYHTYSCTVCGWSESSAHTYKNGTCIACGWIEGYDWAESDTEVVE